MNCKLKITLMVFTWIISSSYYLLGQNLVPMQESDFLKVKLETPVNAYPFPVSAVTLPESKFKQTMEVHERFLFNLEPDRLLSAFRSNAGLEPKAERYEGWESSGLAGHSLGHWLKRENNLTFTSVNNTSPDTVELRPFNEMVNEHYTVYWDFFTPEQWIVRQKVYEEEQLKTTGYRNAYRFFVPSG